MKPAQKIILSASAIEHLHVTKRVSGYDIYAGDYPEDKLREELPAGWVTLVEVGEPAADDVERIAGRETARNILALASPHPDDLAVDRFAAAMKAKLAKKRDDGYGGWDDPDECSIEYLSYLLVQHLHKGDPVDIANFAMMLHQRGSKLIVDADTAAISKLLPTTNSAAAHPSSAQDSPPIVWWFRDHTGCDYIGMDGELHRKRAEGMGEVAQRMRVAPLDYGQRQVDAIMNLIEERLAIIWARPGSREFFEAELRTSIAAIFAIGSKSPYRRRYEEDASHD